MRVDSFAEIEAEFIQRVHTAVWAAVATVGRDNRPRSRLLHILWEGATGWTLTRRHSHKSKHLAHNPYVSLTYMADIIKPVYVDCRAAWVDDKAEIARLWQKFSETPPPLGYDPYNAFVGPEDENTGLLKFTPWRITLYELGGSRTDWQAEEA